MIKPVPIKLYFRIEQTDTPIKWDKTRYKRNSAQLGLWHIQLSINQYFIKLEFIG